MKLADYGGRAGPGGGPDINITYFSAFFCLFIVAIPILPPFLRKIKYENAPSRLHSLNVSNDLLCRIANLENVAFASNCAEAKAIFVLYNVIFDVELVDFYTNVCYSILSTFEEG